MSLQPNPIMNLDIRCAELGRQLSRINNIDEKILNDALAVLEEQGPYAVFLYIQARHSGVASEFLQKCVSLLREVFSDKEIPANGDALEVVKQLAENLDDLLFARDLLRNALGYARYHLKAKGS
ncbi:hypothetical protein HRbin18_02023 [bacterium HR18]|nr:hypothetical protein HRbin18_02023 [bacterium HR18]